MDLLSHTFRSWTLCNDMSRFSQCIRRVTYISKIPSWQRSSYIFSLCIRHTIKGWVVITHSKVLRWAHYQNLVLPSATALGGCLILVRLLSTGLTYHIKCHLDPTINLEIVQNSSAILGTNGFSDTYILEVNSPSHGYWDLPCITWPILKSRPTNENIDFCKGNCSTIGSWIQILSLLRTTFATLPINLNIQCSFTIDNTNLCKRVHLNIGTLLATLLG